MGVGGGRRLSLTPRFIAESKGFPLTNTNRFNGFAWTETVKTVQRNRALVLRPPAMNRGVHESRGMCDASKMRQSFWRDFKSFIVPPFCGKLCRMQDDSTASASNKFRMDFPSILAFTALTAICLTLTFVPLRASHDEWWHLKTGKWIAENGLPKNDIFTYTAEDIPWHNHEWLSQVLFWRIYEFGEATAIGGLRALIAFKALFITLTFFGIAIFSARKTGAPALAAPCSAMACGLARRTFYPRPPFITYGLLAVTFCLLISWREKRIGAFWLFLLVPLFALWANLHGGFMAGLVVVGAFWLESATDWGLNARRTGDPAFLKNRFAIISILLGLCFLATLATPYSYQLYFLAGRVMNDERLKGIIYELQPADWTKVWILDACLILMLFGTLRPRDLRGFLMAATLGFVALVLMRGAPLLVTSPSATNFFEVGLREAFAVLVLALAAWRSKQSVGIAQGLLLIFFAHQAIQHVRHLPLLAVILAPVMTQVLADWIKQGARAWDKLGAVAALALAAFYLCWPGPAEAYYFLFPEKAGATRAQILHGRKWIDRNLALLSGTDMEPGEYPVEAVNYLISNQLPPRLWNGGNYAGYLIWRLSPDLYKVFTDNRYDIFGGKFMRDEQIVRNAFAGDPAEGIPDWRRVLRKWDARTLLIQTDEKIQNVLSKEGEKDWVEVWNDGRYAIWVDKSVHN